MLRDDACCAEVITFFGQLPKALVGIEACPGGHYWARELCSLGHDVRLIPPQYIRSFVKTNKNDAADAEGICEAVVRPNMRCVPIKSVAQQAARMLHRTRALLLRQRTQLINAMRGHPRRRYHVPPRLFSRWTTPSASDPGVTSQPGSGSYHDKVRVASVRFSVGSANAATAMSAPC